MFLRSYFLSVGFRRVGKRITFGRVGLLKGAKYIEIGNYTSFDDGWYLTAWESYSYLDIDGSLKQQKLSPKIRIASNCSFGANVHITCTNRVEIAEGCLVGKCVTITDNSHGRTERDWLRIPPASRELKSKGPVVIERNVWIGDKVTILPNVHIGESVVIGANCVVNKDIPPFCVAVGNPIIIYKKE